MGNLFRTVGCLLLCVALLVIFMLSILADLGVRWYVPL